MEREEQLCRAELRQGSVTLDTLRGISNLSKEVDAGLGAERWILGTELSLEVYVWKGDKQEVGKGRGGSHQADKCVKCSRNYLDNRKD